MENLSHALYLAAAMLAFVVAFTAALILVNKLNSTASEIVYSLDGSYYDSFSLRSLIEDNEDRNRARIVGIDTIIPTLYRYYKESFAVKILDKDGNLLQYFDKTTEGDVNSAKNAAQNSATNTAELNKRRALLALYDNQSLPCYMFGAPWLANVTRDAKTRVDMYIAGETGYINNVKIDYSSNNLLLYKGDKFKEIFTQYAYEGDTVTNPNDNDEEEITAITGNKQIATKIIIIYQLIAT